MALEVIQIQAKLIMLGNLIDETCELYEDGHMGYTHKLATISEHAILTAALIEDFPSEVFGRVQSVHNLKLFLGNTFGLAECLRDTSIELRQDCESSELYEWADSLGEKLKNLYTLGNHIGNK